jgi:hypothetical protein
MTKAGDGRSAATMLVTSASGAEGNGRGTLLAFDPLGVALGPWATKVPIVDPRGLCVRPDGRGLYVNNGDDRLLLLDDGGAAVAATPAIPGLNPGGGVVAADGRYCVGSRTMRTILAFPADLRAAGMPLVPQSVVAFPRGFAFAPDGRLFLAAGARPGDTKPGVVLVFSPAGGPSPARFVEDAELSPLDLTLGPNGNLVISSEYPFGAPNAMTTVREYDSARGALARVFKPGRSVRFQRPRGLRFAPDGRLMCVTRDEVVAFDFDSGRCIGAVVRFDELHGQAIEFFPRRS